MNHPEMQSLDLFHVTSAPFEKPDFDVARKKLAHEHAQPKGILGFWLSTNPVMCKSFGGWVAQVAVKEGAKPLGMDVGILMRFHNAADETQTRDQHLSRYETLRERLREHGDVLFILDAKPLVGEVVVLNPDVLHALDFQSSETNPLRGSVQPIPEAWTNDEDFTAGNGVVKRMLDEERAAKAQAFVDAAVSRGPRP